MNDQEMEALLQQVILDYRLYHLRVAETFDDFAEADLQGKARLAWDTWGRLLDIEPNALSFSFEIHRSTTTTFFRRFADGKMSSAGRLILLLKAPPLAPPRQEHARKELKSTWQDHCGHLSKWCGKFKITVGLTQVTQKS
jgi:hypothetical protein